MRYTTKYSALFKKNGASIFSFLNLSVIQGVNVLVQIILIPIITRSVGLSVFGSIMLAASYAALFSIVVNYGSNQSGVKDVALYKDQPQELSNRFYHIYLLRIFLFVIGLGISIMLYQIEGWQERGKYLFFAQALILSEMLNPLFFFVGIQRLLLYNIVNLIFRLLSLVLILLVVKNTDDGIWVNFLLGMPSAIGYLLLCVYLVKKYKLYHIQFSVSSIKNYVQQNFYLTGNNICVQLQQSFFLFALSGMHDPLLLGAYSLCDKFVWSFRMLLISFFNVFYPRAAVLYKEHPEQWTIMKKKLSKALWIGLGIIGLLLFLTADPLVQLVTGEKNELSTVFIRSISLVPLIAGLNSLNVADLLLRNHYADIFRIAVILLAIAVVISLSFLQWANSSLFGLFPMLVEIFSIPLYLYFIKRADNNP